MRERLLAGVLSGVNNGCGHTNLWRGSPLWDESRPGGDNPNVPYIIRPRYSAIAREQPMNPVANIEPGSRRYSGDRVESQRVIWRSLAGGRPLRQLTRHSNSRLVKFNVFSG